MIFYDYVRKKLFIAALLHDIFGRISQVIAVLSLGQQSDFGQDEVIMAEIPMQTFQTVKSSNAQVLKDFSVSKQYRSTAPQHAPDSISPRPWSNLAPGPHPSSHWISWSHIFKNNFNLWSRYSNREPPWHRFPSSRQHFSHAAAPGEKKCPGVTGEGENHPFGTISRKKTQRFQFSY